MKKNMSQPKEHRQFFRVDDKINLFFKKVDKSSINRASELESDVLHNFSLAAALDIMSQESQVILNRIERKNTDISNYLRVMDNKINLIARTLLMDGNELIEQESRNASLSASGVAFEAEEKLKEGDFLELRLLLASSMAIIVCYGYVVYCRKNKENEDNFPYVIGVAYSEIKEQDQELLIKHVVKRQMQQIREHKEN